MIWRGRDDVKRRFLKIYQREDGRAYGAFPSTDSLHTEGAHKLEEQHRERRWKYLEAVRIGYFLPVVTHPRVWKGGHTF